MAVKRGLWVIGFGFWVLGLMTSSALAQLPSNPSPKTQNPSLTSRNGKKFFVQNGKPLPLLWAFGLTEASQLDDYKQNGFNTLVISLEWSGSPGEAIALAPRDLKAPRALSEAAARRGLNIIYQLPAAPIGREHEFKISGDEGVYSLMWSSWITGAINELRDTPNLLGWMLPDDPRSLPIFDNKGFAKWLAANYADVEILNKQWHQQFPALDRVKLQSAGTLASEWQKNLAAEEEPTTSLTGLPLPTSASSSANGWAFHPAALAVALYKWDAYRDLLEFWVKTLRATEPDATLFAGRLPDYAQLLSLPASLDVSLPDLAPGVAEADVLTHNPQGTSIARRGGRFAAIPVFATNGNPALSANNLPRFMASWLDAALAHGASGFAFSSWPDLQRNITLKATIAANLARLQMMPFAMLWDKAPQASAAILLTPLAEGLSVQKEIDPLGGAQLQFHPQYQPQLQGSPPEENAKDATGRGLYGFGEDIIGAEPSNLVYTLRQGTAFGAVDYLAPEDLSDENSDLSGYNTLLLPQALSVSEKLSARLGQFAAKGGIVVADLGLGAAQAAGKVTEISPSLLALFGMSSSLQLRQDKGNLQQIQVHPLFPSWGQVQPGTWLTNSRGGPAFRGPVASGAPRPDAISIAGSRVPRDPEDADEIAFLTFRPLGAGGAIFAPWLLWQNWLPGAAGFDGFHGDLFSRGALVVQNGARSFAPTTGDPIGGTSFYPETVNFQDAIALLNHTPPTLPVPVAPEGAANETPDLNAQAALALRDWSQVQTGAPGDWLWSNVITAFSPAGMAPALGAPRPAPLIDPSVSDERPQLVALHTYTPPGAMMITRMAPIRVRHLTGGPLMARLMDWQEKKAVFAIWPNATAFTPQSNSFQITPGPSAGVRAVLYDSPDGYRILPNSRHTATITTLALPPAPNPPIIAPFPDPKARKGKKPPPPPPEPKIPAPTTQELMADAQGRLTLDVTGAALMLEVTPLG